MQTWLLCALLAMMLVPEPAVGEGLNAGEAEQYYDTPVFWHVSGVELDPHYNCVGKYGNMGDSSCGSPVALLNSTAHFIHSVSRLNSPLFIAITGDYSAGTNVPLDERIANMEQVVGTIVAPGRGTPAPVFLTLGDRDFLNFGPDPNGPAGDLYMATAALMKDHLAEAEYTRASKLGYFTAVVPKLPKFRIVCLNTQFFATKEPDVFDGSLAPFAAEQMSWLDGVLSAAAQQSEKVLLVGHAAPGVETASTKVDNNVMPRYLPLWSNRMHAIVASHQDTVLGLITGGERIDTVRLLRTCPEEEFPSCGGVVTAPVFVAPSVAPSRPSKNPSVRRFSMDIMDIDTPRLLNYEQFYADLEKGNKGLLLWDTEYTPLAHYGTRDLSAAEVTRLVGRLVNTTSDANMLYAKYRRHFFVSVPPSYAAPCIQECKVVDLCNMQFADMPSFVGCVVKARTGPHMPTDPDHVV